MSKACASGHRVRTKINVSVCLTLTENTSFIQYNGLKQHYGTILKDLNDFGVRDDINSDIISLRQMEV